MFTLHRCPLLLLVLLRSRLPPFWVLQLTCHGLVAMIPQYVLVSRRPFRTRHPQAPTVAPSQQSRNAATGDDGSTLSPGSPLFWLLLVFALVCCCCLLFALWLRRRRKRDEEDFADVMQFSGVPGDMEDAELMRTFDEGDGADTVSAAGYTTISAPVVPYRSTSSVAGLATPNGLETPSGEEGPELSNPLAAGESPRGSLLEYQPVSPATPTPAPATPGSLALYARSSGRRRRSSFSESTGELRDLRDQYSVRSLTSTGTQGRRRRVSSISASSPPGGLQLEGADMDEISLLQDRVRRIQVDREGKSSLPKPRSRPLSNIYTSLQASPEGDDSASTSPSPLRHHVAY